MSIFFIGTLMYNYPPAQSADSQLLLLLLLLCNPINSLAGLHRVQCKMHNFRHRNYESFISAVSALFLGA